MDSVDGAVCRSFGVWKPTSKIHECHYCLVLDFRGERIPSRIKNAYFWILVKAGFLVTTTTLMGKFSLHSVTRDPPGRLAACVSTAGGALEMSKKNYQLPTTE
jgi:hypothetical protein